ncbi:MAG: rRNA maturation RNase YbeY [Oscillatoriales cyanobacterium SM2_2_1]|nr:rRNA maturation RNase YbeY [Oscillatoriales cyanobacterium SM2_2_1]
MAISVCVIGAMAAEPIGEDQWERWFAIWATQMAIDQSIAPCTELTLKFTDDVEMTVLNRTYRQQDRPTDVLAFAALEADIPLIEDSEPVYLGDIVIAVPTAARQAADQNHALARELAWLASHGFLHLLGWDHPDECQLQAMLSQQETLLGLITHDLDIFPPAVLL